MVRLFAGIVVFKKRKEYRFRMLPGLSKNPVLENRNRVL